MNNENYKDAKEDFSYESFSRCISGQGTSLGTMFHVKENETHSNHEGTSFHPVCDNKDQVVLTRAHVEALKFVKKMHRYYTQEDWKQFEESFMDELCSLVETF